METTPALAASIGVALTLAATGFALLSCGLAIRDAGLARISPLARYERYDDARQLNRWIGDRVAALGLGAVAAALAAFAWAQIALLLLGLFTVIAAVVVGLVAAGPPNAGPAADPDTPPRAVPHSTRGVKP